MTSRSVIGPLLLVVALATLGLGSRAVHQPPTPVPGPPPAAEVLEIGRAGGVPLQIRDGRTPVVTDPTRLRVAVSPWVALRLDRGVLDEASRVLSPPQSRLQVRYVVRSFPTRSTMSMTGAGFQVGRCGAYHGMAVTRYGESVPDVPTIAIATGRVHLCGETYRLDHDQQVALVVHETAHLLGLGHVCEGDRCRSGEPPGCTHLMAGRWFHDCDGPIDMASLDAALTALYPVG